MVFSFVSRIPKPVFSWFPGFSISLVYVFRGWQGPSVNKNLVNLMPQDVFLNCKRVASNTHVTFYLQLGILSSKSGRFFF